MKGFNENLAKLKDRKIFTKRDTNSSFRQIQQTPHNISDIVQTVLF